MENRIDYVRTAEGGYRICFESPFFYGDRVAFDSINGRGEGHVADITLARDGSVYYVVEAADGTAAYGGIYAREMRLLARGGPESQENA